MPQQQVFLGKQTGDRRIEVLKTYDRQFAREVFVDMDASAQSHLWQWLVDESYAPEEIPTSDAPDRSDFLWEETLDAAREDGNRLSFFVVTEGIGREPKCVYVSPDWPSAEAFAKDSLGAIV